MVKLLTPEHSLRVLLNKSLFFHRSKSCCGQCHSTPAFALIVKINQLYKDHKENKPILLHANPP